MCLDNFGPVFQTCFFFLFPLSRAETCQATYAQIILGLIFSNMFFFLFPLDIFCYSSRLSFYFLGGMPVKVFLNILKLKCFQTFSRLFQLSFLISVCACLSSDWLQGKGLGAKIEVPMPTANNLRKTELLFKIVYFQFLFTARHL